MLRGAAEAIEGGRRDYAAIEREAVSRLEEAGFEPNYFEVRRAADLTAPGEDDRRLVILAAAWLGRARLIDNLPIDL